MAKKTTNPIESDFSAAVQDAFDGWCQRVERGRGMRDGFPDLVFLLPSGIELCELKIGSLIDGVLWSDEVRPSQIQFHHELADNGGQSFFLVGCWVGGASKNFVNPINWRAFAFDGAVARHWETTGFVVGETCFEIDMNNLYDSLSEYVYRELEN